MPTTLRSPNSHSPLGASLLCYLLVLAHCRINPSKIRGGWKRQKLSALSSKPAFLSSFVSEWSSSPVTQRRLCGKNSTLWVEHWAASSRVWGWEWQQGWDDQILEGIVGTPYTSPWARCQQAQSSREFVHVTLGYIRSEAIKVLSSLRWEWHDLPLFQGQINKCYVKVKLQF